MQRLNQKTVQLIATTRQISFETPQNKAFKQQHHQECTNKYNENDD